MAGTPKPQKNDKSPARKRREAPAVRQPALPPPPQRLEQAARVLACLRERYPSPATHLVAHSPWQLLAATVLAAQCTDARVNLVTPRLFARWPTATDMAEAARPEVEDIIRSTGFFRNKAANLIAAARRVRDTYGGEVPRTMAELITLPGVARKTANVVLWGAFQINEGLAVDTHVGRIARRLGLTDQRAPEAVERDLMALFPRGEWGNVNHRLVWFGREVCRARRPDCAHCPLAAHCPSAGETTT